jgi:hypothetical protein
MSKPQLKNFAFGVWDIIKRSLGLGGIAFVTGAGIGSMPALGGNPLHGALIAFGSMFAIVMSVLGAALASNGTITQDDRTGAFRQAVTKGLEDAKAAEEKATPANTIAKVTEAVQPAAPAVDPTTLDASAFAPATPPQN